MQLVLLVLIRSNSSVIILQNLLHCLPRSDYLMPPNIIRILLLQLLDPELVFEDYLDPMVPSDERYISIRALIANKILLSFQCAVQHIVYSEDLILVPLLGARKLLVMVFSEPYRLPEVGPLSSGLEKQPLFHLELLGDSVVRQLPFLVIGLDEVFDDGTGFPESDVRVWILDSGQTTVMN